MRGRTRASSAVNLTRVTAENSFRTEEFGAPVPEGGGHGTEEDPSGGGHSG